MLTRPPGQPGRQLASMGANSKVAPRGCYQLRGLGVGNVTRSGGRRRVTVYLLHQLLGQIAGA